MPTGIRRKTRRRARCSCATPRRRSSTTNDSPDIPFDASINPYRGCEHGCAYCYARPFHEYLGFSAGLDFETKIMVKTDAPALLRRGTEFAEVEAARTIAMSGVTDCYQPAERRFRITRGCLEVLAEFRNPVGIVTKNHLVTRDLDLLGELARFNAAAVYVSRDHARHHAGREHRAAHLDAGDAPARHRATQRGGDSRRRDGGAGDSRAQRAGDPCDPRCRAAGGCAGGGLRSVALALRGEGHFQRLAGATLSGSAGKGAQSHPGDAWWQVERSQLQFAHERAGDLRRADREAVRCVRPQSRFRDGDMPKLSAASFRRPGGTQLPLF